MFCIALALQDGISDMENCNDNDIREYKKQTKKAFKVLKNK